MSASIADVNSPTAANTTSSEPNAFSPMEGEIRRLQDLLQAEAKHRSTVDAKLEDVALYAAALEHRVLGTKAKVAEIEDILLRELMVYKREALTEYDAHVFHSSIRNALVHEADASEALVVVHRRQATHIAALQARCTTLETTCRAHEVAAQTTDAKWQETMHASNAKHADEVLAYQTTIEKLKRQLAATSGKRLIEKAGLSKDKVSLLRRSLEGMRTTMVDFQRAISEGLLIGSNSSHGLSATRRRSSAIGRHNMSERWRRGPPSASSSGARPPSLGRSGSTTFGGRHNSIVHFAGGAPDADDSSPSAKDQRVSAMPSRTSFSDDVDSPEAPTGRGLGALTTGGGLMGRMMKALDAAGAHHGKMATRLTSLYQQVLMLHASAIDLEVSTVLSPLPPLEELHNDDVDVEASTASFLKQLNSAMVAMHRNLISQRLAMQEVVLQRDDAVAQRNALTQEVAHRRATSKTVSCGTDLDASNWAFVIRTGHDVDGGRTLVDDAGVCVDNGPHVPVNVRPISGASGTVACAPPLDGPQGAVHASTSVASPLDGTTAATPHQRGDSEPPAVAAQWVDHDAVLHDVADAFARARLVRTCTIQWLMRFHRRKQRSLDGFLSARVAPLLAGSPKQTRPSSGREPVRSASQRPPPPSSGPTLVVSSFGVVVPAASPRPPSAPTVRQGAPMLMKNFGSSVHRPFPHGAAPPEGAARQRHSHDKPDLDWIQGNRMRLEAIRAQAASTATDCPTRSTSS